MIEPNEELMIDRSNFTENRKSYGITIKQIAEKAKLSYNVISNFENYTGQYTQTRTRDDNARVIIRALKDLIQERINEAFPYGNKNSINNIKEKENEIMENETTREITLTELAESVVKESSKSNKKKPTFTTIGYRKEAIATKLRKYCKEKGVGMKEFCDMCGVNSNTLSPYYIKLSPVMREDILKKICNATGLDISMFDEDRNEGPIAESNKVNKTNINEIEIKKIEPKKIEEIVGNKVIEMKSIPTETIKDKVEIRDKKYTFQDGEYYEEYIEIRHIRKPIGKEDFLKAIQAAS